MAPQAPAPGTKDGCSPFAVETMLRIHLLQKWFNFSDPAMEGTSYKTLMFREFAGLYAGEDNLPDESTILRSRHLLEAHSMSLQVLTPVNITLAAKGLLLKMGTDVDATLIAATNSTTNSNVEHDHGAHQTKNSNQWHFGKKPHLGMNADLDLVHKMMGTAAKARAGSQAQTQVQGLKPNTLADARYEGIDKRADTQDLNVNWHVAMRPGKHKPLTKRRPKRCEVKGAEPDEARVRTKVEHTFRVSTRKYRHMKVRYRDLTKNTVQLHTLPVLSNPRTVRCTLPQGIRRCARPNADRGPRNG